MKKRADFEAGSFVFPVRLPEVAYRDTMLWLPKEGLNVNAVKQAMTLVLDDQNLTLWKETRDHLIVPREAFEGTSRSSAATVVNPEFSTVEFKDSIIPREDQKEAWAALDKAPGGIFNLSCGRGKTVLGLKKIASRKMPAIVIVNQAALMEQWKHEAMQFLGLEEDQIGWIRQSTFDWEKPLVLAMIHTLSKKCLQWPRAFRRFYGTVIYDEVHHLSAPTFAKTAPLFWGARYGLTATPDRVDKTEFAYFSHLGKVFFSDMSQPLTPRIYFQRLPTEVDMKSDEITDCYGEFNISKFRKYLATRPDRIDLITKDVADAFEQGRRILVLTHIVKGAQMLEKALPGAVRVTGKTKAEKRLSIFKENRLVVATMGVAQEWLNVPDLDTVFFTTPFGNWGSLVQGMGRVLRVHPDKKAPVAMIYEDYKLGPGRALCNRLRRGLRSNGFGWKVLSPSETD